MHPSLLLGGRLMTAVLLLASHGGAKAAFADDVLIDPVAAKQNPHATVTAVQFQRYLQLPAKLQTDPQKHLQSLLKVKVLTLEAKCSLTAEQRDKLQLAGQGDIARIVGSLAKLRAQYVDKPLAAEGLAAMQSEIYCRGTVPLTHPFTEGSLFHKVLTKSLSAEQFARFDEWDRTRRSVEIRAVFEPFVRGNLKLSEAGQRDLTELILKKYPHWRPPHPDHQLVDQQLVAMMMLNELQDEIRPLVDAREWERVKKCADSGLRLEPHLRAMGLWPINGAEDDSETQ